MPSTTPIPPLTFPHDEDRYPLGSVTHRPVGHSYKRSILRSNPRRSAYQASAIPPRHPDSHHLKLQHYSSHCRRPRLEMILQINIFHTFSKQTS